MLKILSEGKKQHRGHRTGLLAIEPVARSCAEVLFVFVDRKRSPRPFRLGFLAYEWEIDGITLRVEGEEPHNGSSLIKLDEVDFTWWDSMNFWQ